MLDMIIKVFKKHKLQFLSGISSLSLKSWRKGVVDKLDAGLQGQQAKCA